MNNNQTSCAKDGKKVLVIDILDENWNPTEKELKGYKMLFEAALAHNGESTITINPRESIKVDTITKI